MGAVEGRPLRRHQDGPLLLDIAYEFRTQDKCVALATHLLKGEMSGLDFVKGKTGFDPNWPTIAFEVLNEWCEIKAKEATGNALLDVLEKIKMGSTAEKFRQKLTEANSECAESQSNPEPKKVSNVARDHSSSLSDDFLSASSSFLDLWFKLMRYRLDHLASRLEPSLKNNTSSDLPKEQPPPELFGLTDWLIFDDPKPSPLEENMKQKPLGLTDWLIFNDPKPSLLGKENMKQGAKSTKGRAVNHDSPGLPFSSPKPSKPHPSETFTMLDAYLDMLVMIVLFTAFISILTSYASSFLVSSHQHLASTY